jgi:type IV pilus assembly protein PilY1
MTYDAGISVRAIWFAVAAATVVLASEAARATPLNIADTPLFLDAAVAPLNMLVVGRDHKLYYEAYNDRSDLDEDGLVDTRYKPEKIDYYGYFDSFKCYSYDGSEFVPVSATADKRCTNLWSGDWLNYVTTARIDALRKVFYGGFRRIDTGSRTVLERTHIPHDAHGWAKEYRGIATEGYDIRDYTPLGLPNAGRTHLFGNLTPMPSTQSTWLDNDPDTNPPLLRVAPNVAPQTAPVAGGQTRPWHWASTESAVLTECYSQNGANGGGCGSGRPTLASSTEPSGSLGGFTQFVVRVEVCVPGLLESNCRLYPSGAYKPIGLLQQYGENDAMRFGLLTSSYQRSKSGGMLRKPVGTLSSEINITGDGTYRTGSGAYRDPNGIIATLDKLRAAGYNRYTSQGGVYYLPGLVTTRPFNNGEFGGMWGNPIAEMMYETLRYYAGRTGPIAAFDYGSGTTFDSQLGLPRVSSWSNPYGSGAASCAKPFMTVISDINASYDSNELPGSSFGGAADTLGGLNVASEANDIWNHEFGGTRSLFIGQSGIDYDGAPSPKTASSFATLRGLAPEEPTKQGSYYAASVARFGLRTDISSAGGQQRVQTFAVALASPLPRIEIPVNGSRVTIVPFAKSVAGASIDAARGAFQPTNQIVDFYVESMAADGSSGEFLVNFEDVEAGNDHDMDMIVRYAYQVIAGNVQVTVQRLYQAGSITHHAGYVISGTTADGIYLVVQDDTSNVPYFLDTPVGRLPGECGTSLCLPREVVAPAGAALPWLDVRTFMPGASPGAILLKDPLWYAAKWGGFRDSNNNNRPDLDAEWDENGDGDPDNYFLVTNALNLSSRLGSAFSEIMNRVGSASSASVNSGSINSETRVFQARFRSASWSGELLSYGVNPDGTLDNTRFWNAANALPLPDDRRIITVNSDGVTAVPFRWDDLDPTRRGQLNSTDPPSELRGADRVGYLRGFRTFEQRTGNVGAIFRDRDSVLGDIVNSAPAFVGRPSFLYRDSLESAPYSAFRSAYRNRPGMVYVGANDGMLHAFDAETGQERFAFIPGAVFGSLPELTRPSYSHRYFVDGSPTAVDAFIGGAWRTVLASGLNKGGQSVFALDVTDPAGITESTANQLFLWEFTDANDADLGYTFSRPAVVRLANGRWAAVFGNGYNSTVPDGHVSATGSAVLFIVDLETGDLVRKIDTGVGLSHPSSGGRPNGLTTPALVDMNGDQIADLAYAGDLLGNVWKFDLRDSSPTNWGVAYQSSGTPQPLFTARDPGNIRQPITVRPEVTRGPDNVGLMVLFGTGKYLEPSDEIVGSLQPQSFYGIWDQNTGTAADRVTGRAQLTQQQITDELAATFDGPNGPQSFNLRVTTDNDTAGTRGWYIDLISPAAGFQGEMQVTDPVLRNGRIIFTTLIPNPDVCAYGGTSWLMELNAVSGRRLSLTPFDLNGDGLFNAEDYVELADGSRVPVSGIQTDVGITPKPAVLAGENSEFKFMPGTSGEMQVLRENPGAGDLRRQSWRQLR